MKNLKFNGFFGILFSLFFIEACKEIDVDLNPDLRTVIAICEILASDNDSKVRIYSVELDEGSVNVRESMVAAGEGSTFKMDGEGVDFSFIVNEWGGGTGQEIARNGQLFLPPNVSENYKNTWITISRGDNKFVSFHKLVGLGQR